MTLINKIFKWLNIVYLVGCVGVFSFTMDVELLFIALISLSVVWGLKENTSVQQEIVAHCGIILGILGYLVFSASWAAFVFLILVYASALVFLKISAEDIDKMHQEAS